MKNIFLFVLALVLTAVVVNELYPELRLAARIRNRLSFRMLGPQPEPPDMPYAAESKFQPLEPDVEQVR